MMRNVPMAVLAMLVADALALALGVAWLSNLIGFEKAIAGGLLPFLTGEALKIVLAAALLTATRSLRRAA